MMTSRHITAAEVRHQQELRKARERERERERERDSAREMKPERKRAGTKTQPSERERALGFFSMMRFDSATSSLVFRPC